MAYDLQDQEQLDNIKEWWKQWGNTIVTALTVVALVIAAWNGWKWYQSKQGSEAAVAFEGFQKVLAAKDAKKTSAAADALVQQFPRTAFAGLSALNAAKAAFDAGDLAAAKKHLQWVADNAKDEELRHVAKLRLAGVLIDEKAYDAALAVVNGTHPEHYAGVYADRKGDIYFSQGKLEEARAAYLLAWEKTEKRAQSRGLIQTKLEAAGGQVPKEPEAKPAA